MRILVACEESQAVTKELRQMRKSLTMDAVQPVTEADAFFTAA